MPFAKAVSERDRPKGFITPDEAAKKAGVARATVYGWVRRGLVKPEDVQETKHPMSGFMQAVWLRDTAIPAKSPKKKPR